MTARSPMDEALRRVREARAPPRRRRARTPVLLQLTETECGAACLGIVLAHFGRWVSIEELRETCSVGRDGCSAADVFRAARRYGLEPEGRRRQPGQLGAMPLPMILFWEFNHFVVLEGFRNGRFLINDPANGHRTIGAEEFDRAFTGVTLTFRPGPRFRPGGVRPGLLYRVLPWLRDVKKPLAFALCCGLLLALPALALPFLLTLFVDFALSGREPAWGGVLTGGVLAAAGLLYLLTWLRERCLRRLSVRLSVDHAERFMSRLFRLPMRFFSHRYSGDLTTRIQLIDQVSEVATRHLVGIFIELVASMAFLGLMLAYDPAALRRGRRAGRARRPGHARPGADARGREPPAAARAGAALRGGDVRPRQDRRLAGHRRRGRLLLALDGAPGARAARPATLRRARLRERGPAGGCSWSSATRRCSVSAAGGRCRAT